MPHINDVLELLKTAGDRISYLEQFVHPDILVDMKKIPGYDISNLIKQMLHEYEILKTGHLART